MDNITPNTSSLDNFGSSRRTLLKSASVFAGASLLASSGGEIMNAQSRSQQSTGPLHKGMVGFQLGHEQFPIEQIVELGVLCEQAGFDLITSSDHLQPWQANQGHSGNAWLSLAAIGQKTQRIWMGTTVTCPTFRYTPPVVAQAFASLSRLFPGRIFLGLGSGEALNEQVATGIWPKWPERSERLVEATDIIRKLWTGNPTNHQGKYYKVNARLYDPPAKAIPLLMAGNGPKAMHRCGQYADGLITDPKTWQEQKSQFEAGAKAGQKQSAQMPVFIEQFVVVGDKKEAETAAKLWRFLPKAWKPYFNIPDPAEIEKRANAEIPLEEIYKSMVVSTDPMVHVDALKKLFAGGATEVHIHSGQPDQRKVIEFYGKEVIPRFKRAA